MGLIEFWTQVQDQLVIDAKAVTDEKPVLFTPVACADEGLVVELDPPLRPPWGAPLKATWRISQFSVHGLVL